MAYVKIKFWKGASYLKRLLFNAFLFLLLIATLFIYPQYPQYGIDYSWAMALSQFIHDGLQFGSDVIFTFGPLGFLYGHAYIGLHFWSHLFWQLFSASIFAIIIIDNARLLTGSRQVIYITFFILLGNLNLDALHQMIIVMIGFKLISLSGKDWRPITSLLVLFLALLAMIKFTNLLLATFSVVIFCLQELFRGRWHIAIFHATFFFAGFLVLWIACGQNPINLPMYLYNSWQISQGYQQTMGVLTPVQPFWLGITVLITLSFYGLLYLVLNFDKPHTLSRFTLLAAFIFFVWKHGFNRSDNHMFIFFVSALLPVISFPALLDDPPHRRWLSQSLLTLAGILCVLGIHSTNIHLGRSDAISDATSRFINRLWRHYDFIGHWKFFHTNYDIELEKEKQQFNLPHTREIIDQAPIDVIGYEQVIVLYNGFTYRPRPVFQSYSTFTPQLARLNDDFYRSSQAPEYVLFKIQTIDNRFPTLDDSLLLRSFPNYYEYVHTERGFQLWKRRLQPQLEGGVLTSLLRSENIKLNQSLKLGELANKRLWVTIRLKPSWLGRIRDFIYKLPMVSLTVEDTQGQHSTFRLTLPQAATGFILNPLIQDNADYLCFSIGTGNRQVRALTIEVPEKNRKFFSETVYLELSELPPVSNLGSSFNCHD